MIHHLDSGLRSSPVPPMGSTGKFDHWRPAEFTFRRSFDSQSHTIQMWTDHLTVSKWSLVFICFTDDPLREDRQIKGTSEGRSIQPGSHRASPEFHGSRWNFGFGSGKTSKDAALDYLSMTDLLWFPLSFSSCHRSTDGNTLFTGNFLSLTDRHSFPLFCKNKFIQNQRIYLFIYQ